MVTPWQRLNLNLNLNYNQMVPQWRSSLCWPHFWLASFFTACILNGNTLCRQVIGGDLSIHHATKALCYESNVFSQHLDNPGHPLLCLKLSPVCSSNHLSDCTSAMMLSPHAKDLGSHAVWGGAAKVEDLPVKPHFSPELMRSTQ